MSLSMYQASLPVLIRMMGNLSTLLEKAAAHAEAKKIQPDVLVNARLAPDMRPLSFQVQTVSDLAKGCAARLAGIEAPSFPDTETTFPELRARLAKTITFLESVSAAQLDGSEERNIALKLGGYEAQFTGEAYLLTFVLPNFYFHVTTAYAILRHNGLEIGKKDFLGVR